MYSDQKRYEKKVDLTDAERSFPLTSPEIAYKCCAMEGFIYQKNEGRIRSDTGFRIGDINQILPSQMHLELIKTYNAGSVCIYSFNNYLKLEYILLIFYI